MTGVKMKRRVLLSVTALSAMLCLAAMIMWGDSYRWPRSLTHQRFMEHGRPWRLRTVAVTSAEGSIEFWVRREHIYLAKDATVTEGFLSMNGSAVPLEKATQVKLEWR